VIVPLTERAFRLLAVAPVPGCIAEFGVYKGEGLSNLATLARKHLGELPPLYGFDSFEGMPPTDEPLELTLEEFWAEGTFRDTSLEAVQARFREEGVPATLVKGVFSDLSPLETYGIERVAMAHLDADIYEGYRDALQLLTPHLQVGSVLLFDEIVAPNEWRFQSVRQHGQRAVREWEAETGLNLHLIRFEWTVALCVIVDEEYLKTHWRLIDRLRKDSLEESARNIAKILLGREREERMHLDASD
jgi:macrocin-O-methyltransferase TylF-like protien